MDTDFNEIMCLTEIAGIERMGANLNSVRKSDRFFRAGLTCQRVGPESDVIYLSQRFEFLNDDGRVLVNVIQPAPNGTDSQQVVLTWSESQFFGYAGNIIRTWPNQLFVEQFRPGAIVKLKTALQ